MVWLPYGEKKFADMFSRFDRIYRCVTDRRTDGQTSCHSIVCAMHTSCAVIIVVIICD